MKIWRVVLGILIIVLVCLLIIRPPAILSSLLSEFLKFLMQPLLLLLVSVIRFVGMVWTVNVCSILVTLLFILLVRWTLNSINFWRWRHGKEIGPIMIEEIKDHDGLATLMRYTLDRCGASCMNPAQTAAPNATPGFDALDTVLDASNEEKSKIILALLTILKELITSLAGRKYGYIVSCKLSADEGKKKHYIDIEIKLMHNGQLKKSHSLSGESYRDIIPLAAYWIFWYISGQEQFLRMIPPWYRFPTPEGYLNYKKAQNASGKDSIEYYQAAIREAPLNARARLELADHYETNNNYWQALEVYIGAVFIWPHLYGLWYRIAAIFSCPEEWVEKWLSLQDSNRLNLEILIRELFVGIEQKRYLLDRNKGKLNTILDDYNRFTLPDAMFSSSETTSKVKDSDLIRTIFYQRALKIWKFIELDLRTNYLSRLWIKQSGMNIWAWFFNPISFSPHLGKYYWNLIPLLPWSEGEQFRRAVQVAKYCSEIEIISIEENSNEDSLRGQSYIEELNKIVNKISSLAWNDRSVKYNVACYHALLVKLYDKNANERKEHFQTAMKYLIIASKDPRRKLDSTWVMNDPDFNAIKKKPQFSAIFDVPGKDSQENQGKIYVRKLVKMGAKQQLKDWKKKSKESISLEMLLIETEYQITLWKSLTAMMENPGVTSLQESFWRNVNQNAELVSMPVAKAKNKTIKLNPSAWENMRIYAKSQQGIWEKYLENCKLLLQHQKEGENKDKMLKSWAKAEIWIWDALWMEADKLKEPAK